MRRVLKLMLSQQILKTILCVLGTTSKPRVMVLHFCIDFISLLYGSLLATDRSKAVVLVFVNFFLFTWVIQ